MRSELALIFMCLLVGCVPVLDVDESLVTSPRVVAVRTLPAEVSPGEAVHLEVLALDADGVIASPDLGWSLCTGRFGADATDDALPDACARGEALLEIGRGAAVDAAIPREACQLFGPDLPPPVPGEPPGRPSSPDSTGGYAIPVVLDGLDARSVAGVRIRCGLAGATQEQAATFRRRHTPNAAPLPTLAVMTASGVEPIGDTGLDVVLGEAVQFILQWPTCPSIDECGDAVCGPDEEATSCAEDCTTPRGCGGAERYLRFDPVERALVVDREAIRVAWLGGAGAFDVARNGQPSDGDDHVLNTWTAPTMPGRTWIAAVVRDARGATTWVYAPVNASP